MDRPKIVNQKLESFLKRNLPSAEYQRIRCYERCVVDKSMKLALLTSRNLIITDSPPRTILYTLPLIEFLSLNLVQDLPDFLHGDERFKCQHISIKFRDLSCKSESPLSESTGSYVSSASDDIHTEKRPSKPRLALSSSFSSLSSHSWAGSSPRPPQKDHRRLRLNISLDEASSRMDRLNLSDSGSSVSSSHSSISPTADLDIFLLTDTNLFFRLLQAAALNEKIAGTRMLNVSMTRSSKPKRKKSVLRNQLYAQLSSDIQTCKNLERRFYLVQELYTAANNDMNIKSYFWKDLDLCTVLVDDMGTYRQGTGQNNRADEIEYLIELESCLAEMFRESEHLPQRSHLLTTNSLIVLRMLLENLSISPTLSTHLTRDTEIEDLCTELLDTTSKLLFEVLLAVSEHPTFGTELSLSRVISQLESRFSSFSGVYSSMTERALFLISRKSAPSTTFLLYCLFYVVEVLCRNCNKCRTLLTSSHLEDIRYYCSSPELKVVRYTPLQTLTIERVQKLLKLLQ